MTPGEAPEALQARDVVAFGQEFGRVLSDGRIVGRAEPFAKVFASSRAVKRAVGAISWVILEDIALDARIDVEGRLVADTNVRRLADNLGLATNTVAKHLGRLREHGFVLHEEHRDDTSGLYAQSRYVLDPSACLERFTHTPTSTPIRRPVDNGSAETPDRPESSTDNVSRPCRNSCDTVGGTVSQSMRHRGLRHNKEVVVEDEEQQQQAPPDSQSPAPSTDRIAVAVPRDPRPVGADLIEARQLVQRLVAVGVADPQARALVADHPAGHVVEVLDAVEVTDAHSPAGWVVTAIRGSWDVSDAAEKVRRQRASGRWRAQEAASQDLARQREERRLDRAAGWEAAVSAALDDAELTRALRDHTAPVSGVVGRRSVPVAVAQLVGWAVALHATEPAMPLARLLPRSISGPAMSGPGPSVPGDATTGAPRLDSALPEPPAPACSAEPLRARVARLLPAVDDHPRATITKGR